MRALQTPSADDETGFHSNIPVSEVAERDTRAIEASVISSTPSVMETEDGVMLESWPTPTDPYRARATQS